MNIDDKYKKKFLLLGKRIKELRESQNLSQKEFSEKSGLSIKYIKKIESGLAYGIGFQKHMFKIAFALNTKIEEIIKNFY